MKKTCHSKKPEKPNEREERVLRRLRAIAGEHFDDYVIIVRSSDGIAWRSSDRTWGKGACERYAGRIDTDDGLHAADCWEDD